MENSSQVSKQVQSGTLGSSKKVSLALRQAVVRIIIKNRLCCSQPALSPDEFELAVAAWAEVLDFAGVPESRLNEYYLTAMANRKSTFPLGVSEICAAYNQESEYRGPVAEDPAAKAIRVNCPDCYGSCTIPGVPGSVCKHDGKAVNHEGQS